MATSQSLRENMKPTEWNIIRKTTTLLTLDLSGQHLSQLPDELFELTELEALKLGENKDIKLSDKLSRLTNLKLLSLDECNLETVPAAVMKLQHLEILYLSKNTNITLPEEMCSLVNLSVLSLGNCDLKSVPAVVGKLSQLKALRLWNNKKIKLPDEMSSLVNLAYLDLDNCDLDTFPPVVLRLSNVQKLDLSFNQISLPDELCKLENIKVLRLCKCNLATVPPAVLKLTQLEELDLSWNRKIHLPDELAGLTNIRVLKLWGTDMVTVPPVVWRLTQLEWLQLGFNPLQTLPAEIGQITNVKHLDLHECQLSALPPDVWRLTQLEWLNLSFNPLQTLPAEIEQLTNMNHLDLSSCELRTLPAEVWRLTQLEWLDLRSNPLQTLTAEIGQLTNMKYLHLSDCQLRTLPPEVWRLTQLEWLDLSSNPLQTLPAEIGQITNVKNLFLSRCKLHTLPPEMGRLAQLEWLDLSFNPLQTLPAEIGQFTNMKHLDLFDCELRTLPAEVWRLTQLEWLNLRSNPLKTLSAEIGQLTNMKHLDLSKCELHTLSPEVGRMTQLEWLDLRHNSLQALPVEIAQLTNTRHLDVSGNPLIKPPAEVCNQGIVAIRQYFEELERSEEDVSARLKVVVLGEKMAGKTSLVQTLSRGQSTLTEEEDRTHCVEITQWAPDEDMTFEVYDFGGHDVYHLTHQFFLTQDALNVLTVNLQEYRCTEQSYTEAVGLWLDTLNARVPGAVVTVVGSKTDLCSDAEPDMKIRDIQERLRQQLDTWQRGKKQQMKKLKDVLDKMGATDEDEQSQGEIIQQLERTESLLKRPLRLIGMYCVSSAEPTSGHGLDTLRSHILKSANNTSLFPTIRRILPHTWVGFERQMHELRHKGTEKHDSRDVTWSDDDDLSTDDGNSSTDDGDSSILHLQSDKKPKWMTTADCLQQGQLAGLTADRLEPVLSYLQQVGTILRYTDIPELKDFVFYDPHALIEIFKDLFHHDVKELFKTPRLQNSYYTTAELDSFEQDLRDRGLIRKDVMECLLPSNISSDIVATLMQHFGLCFEMQVKDKADLSKHIYMYQIPWYLHKQMPGELLSVWPEVVPEDQEQLQLMCDIGGFCPRGLFQRFNVGIHPHVKNRIDWKDGVMAYIHYVDKDYPIMVCSKPVKRDTYITMATRGKLAQAGEMWDVVYPLLKVLVRLLQEWPGVLYSLHVTCAHCIKARLDNPYQYDLRDRTADDGRDVRCPGVMHTASTSADLVYKPSRLPGSNQRLRGLNDSLSLGADLSGVTEKPSDAKPVVLLVNDEFGTSKGGISTINGQLGDLLTFAGAKVIITVLNATEEEKQEALSLGIDLVLPNTPETGETPTLAWLTDDHENRYPDLPSDINVIVGHSDVTSTVARNIRKDRRPSAKCILFNHVMPEDTEHYKSGDKTMGIGDKMEAIREDTEEADVVFSVGPTMYDYYKTQIKLSKPHHVFLPKPSDIFSQMDVPYVETETKIVLSVGRVKGVEKLKGYDLVAKAMNRVLDRFPKARLRVRGVSAEDFPKSKEIIQANMEKGTFHFTPLKYGTQQQLSTDFKEAHLVLMPSRAEPFGLVGLEAIAAGVPTIVSDQSGLANFLKSQDDVIFDRPIVKIEGNDGEDTTRLADRIVDILENGSKEFKAAKELKQKLLESNYWEESHRKFLEECGIQK